MAFLLLAGCRSQSEPRPTSTRSSGPASPLDAAGEWFVDRAHETGLTFVHFNGMSGAFYYPEIMAPGVALFDFDNDGDLDVFVVQGQMLGGKPVNQALVPPRAPLQGHLYRNELSGSAESLRFTDVTEQSGIVARGYGMGAAAGDVNNDGCVDLYVTNLGTNQLFRNNCDGTFSDVSKASGAADTGWSVSASFFDFDRDGWLDLLVGHYLTYTLANNVQCYSVSGSPDYCPPHVYRPEPSRLYRNRGDGTFADVTTSAGVAAEFGPALGVSTADFNGDGWIDFYVANDGQPNQLWMNQRDGTFRNTALLAGAALSAEGTAKSSMGIDAGDVENDGDEDLFISELTGQGVNLYVNDGSGLFEERSTPSGLQMATLPYTGFGTGWLDFDNDGWLDLVMVNGAVTQNPEAVSRNETFSLQQRKQIYRNLGAVRFEDVTPRAGKVFQLQEVSRGAAIGDIDNDGDPDIVVGNAAGPLRLLINQVGNRRHWIGVRAVGSSSQSLKPEAERPARDMLGARVGIVRTDGSTIWRRARADGSYASANDPRVLVGLGDATSVSRVRVQWPDGQSEEWDKIPIDRYSTLKQGTGKPWR
jgi:hypothetical protein